MHPLEIAGLLLQVVGTGIAARALWRDHREYGDGRGLVPALVGAWAWLRRKLGMAPAQTVVPGATASGGLVARAGAAHGEAPVAEDAPVEDQLAFLRKRMAFLNADIGEVRQEVKKAQREVTAQLADVAAESDRRDAELLQRLAAVAAGRVRQELFGLFLVGLGSIVAAFG